MITNSSRRKQDVGSMKADGGIDDLYILDGDRWELDFPNMHRSIYGAEILMT